MRRENGQWCLGDYGVGENLKVQFQHYDGIRSIQKGTFSVRGSPDYLSPKLKREFLKAINNPNKFIEYSEIDLFKADIFSLGLTFLEVVTDMNISDILLQCSCFQQCSCTNLLAVNDSEKHIVHCVEALAKTKLPIQIQQTILHMIAWEEKHRIPSYALYQ